MLYKWKSYLLEEHYIYLVNFVENVKNNIVNDKMIILSANCIQTDKTVLLLNDITNYLDKNDIHICDLDGYVF